MYKNLHTNNQGNFNNSTYYWSRTEGDDNDAWYFYFGDGDAYGYYSKSNAYYVRAVRAF